jgi:hypothetical protein
MANPLPIHESAPQPNVGHDHVIERRPDGKMRVASGSWDGEKVFLKDQVLKVRHAIADARLQVARKTKAPDDWDQSYES